MEVALSYEGNKYHGTVVELGITRFLNALGCVTPIRTGAHQ